MEGLVAVGLVATDPLEEGPRTKRPTAEITTATAQCATYRSLREAFRLRTFSSFTPRNRPRRAAS